MSAATHPLTYIHPACGQPAFHADAVPKPDDRIQSSRHEHLDGREVGALDPLICETCGEYLQRNEFIHMTNPANYRRRDANITPCQNQIET